MSETKRTQLAVIGGGPGGYAAAFMAADLGLDATIIDQEDNPGGTCLYRGCIPSKALLHAAKVITDAKEADYWGIHFEKPKLDIDRLRQSTNEVVQRMTQGLGQLCKARKVQYMKGLANFSDSQRVTVYKPDGREETLAFEYAIIAAGSRPAILGKPLDSPRLMSSTDALRVESIPKSLLVVGGGYIGLELGTVYATLGAKVTVVEMTGGVLPGVDQDLVKPLAQRLENTFEDIYLDTTVKKMSKQKNGIRVEMEGPEVKKAGRIFERVLVSIGRKPNSSGLGLKNTSVETDDRGYIKVDAQRRTADPNIFAIGDVVGGAMLAHKASAEGRVAAEVIAGKDVVFEPMAIPAVVFTDPEIAWCGLTETQAKEQKLDVAVTRFPWAASGRATTLNRPQGLTKLITQKDSGQILGMGIVGAGAGELIGEGVLAIEMGALASDLDLTIHPHPTLSETLMESAAALFGQATHFHRPRKRGKNEE